MTATAAKLDWVDVWSGPFFQAETIRAVLDGEGYTTFIPHDTIKVFDPFITGSNCLDAQVQVPGSEVESALQFLDAGRDLKSEEPDRADLARIQGNRVRWGLILQLCIYVPFPLFFAAKYDRLIRDLPTPPTRHRLNRAAVIVSWVHLLVAAPIFCVGFFSSL